MSDGMVSMHGLWRIGLAVLISGLLLASTARPTMAQHVTTGLWVANSGGPTVPEFSAGQTSRGSVSSPKPTLINMSTSFFSPQDTVFDTHNNLWVVDGGDGTGDATEGVFMFTNAPAEISRYERYANTDLRDYKFRRSARLLLSSVRSI